MSDQVEKIVLIDSAAPYDVRAARRTLVSGSGRHISNNKIKKIYVKKKSLSDAMKSFYAENIANN